MMADLHADRDQLSRFIETLFRYADEGTFASLRAFDQTDRTVPTKLIRPVRINGDLGHLIDEATDAAERMANETRPIVFAPPICTFSNPDRARVADLANGLTLSVEIDDGDTAAARKKLESLLGPATIIVESGGEWAEPITGEIFPKLHLHWRLNEPTRTDDDHARLRQARDLAARLVGADPTGKPVVHPLRWPGSWNRKGKPRLARIVAFNEAAEIDLNAALSATEGAIEAAGLSATEMPASTTPEAAASLVASAMAAIPNPGAEIHYDTWIRLGYATYRATGGAGYPIWDEWSAKSEKYNATENEAAWRRIGRAILGSMAPRTIGAGTIFFEAAAHGWARPTPEDAIPPESESDPGWWESLERSLYQSPAEVAEVEEPAKPEPPQLADGGIIDPRTWTTEAPLRQWLVQDWIPIGYVTGIYGDGGLGKSLLAQQLLSSVATGHPWLGLACRAGPAFGLMCEDDADELHRRQDAINRVYRVRMEHLELLRYASRVGFDNLLMTFNEHNQGLPTALFSETVKYLTEFKPRLLVIDTLADTFGGDEIRRAHARQFVQGVGGNIARAFSCAVVICAHPSASGMATGSGTSGNTAWSNTFRSRIYLTPGKDENDPDARLISRKKANYAPKDAELTIRWTDGCFVEDGPPRRQEGLERPEIDAIFDEIERAWAVGDPWSASPQTKKFGRYIPLWAAVHLGANERETAKLIERWMADGFLGHRLRDASKKLFGLQVLKRLQP